ncbi:Zinc carboxypeptidase, partial [Phytophthora infestans]
MAGVRCPPVSGEASVEHRVITTGPGKSEWQFADRGLRFSSRFDGGNMAHVQLNPSGSFDVKVSEDAAAFGISTGYTTWFYFEVERTLKAAKQPQDLHVTLVNLNPQRGLFKNGYTIMHSSVEAGDEPAATTTPPCIFQDEERWDRLPSPLSFEKSTELPRQPTNEVESGQGLVPQETIVKGTSNVTDAKKEVKIRLSLSYKFKFARERVRFAFCYPYTYTRVQEELASLDRQFADPKQHSVQSSTSPTPPTKEEISSNVYYHRELLTRSLEGLRVDLVTISSYDGITSSHQSSERNPSKSAYRFDPKQKKMVVISARVHPAETPANFMLNGMLQLLLHPTDESAIALRRHFVFKLIPMLNPDGVCQGFYRTDTRGVNLNRVYEDPQPDLAPTVFALKNLLLDLVNDYGGAQSITAQENVVYLDLHAHANRRGCFIFGNNHLPDMRDVSDAMETAIARQVQTQLYARLVGLHTPFFDYMACLFDKESMTKNDLRDNNNATTSRQGSSRVALYRATGLTYVYTIECNYNEGRRNLRTSTVMPSSSSKRSKASTTSIQPDNLRIPRRTAPTSTRLYLKYSPADWRDVGVGALIALLDLFELPGAGQRIQDSSFRSRDGIMKNLLAE